MAALTAAFLHYGTFHLALNMYSLYCVGRCSSSDRPLAVRAPLPRLRPRGLGRRAVLSPERPTVGASGAIFGILGGALRARAPGHIATGGQIAGLIVLNLIFTFTLSSFISVGGHVGGLIAGVVLMSLLDQYRRSAAMSIAAAIAVIVLSIVVAYSKVRGYN